MKLENRADRQTVSDCIQHGRIDCGTVDGNGITISWGDGETTSVNAVIDESGWYVPDTTEPLSHIYMEETDATGHDVVVTATAVD